MTRCGRLRIRVGEVVICRLGATNSRLRRCYHLMGAAEAKPIRKPNPQNLHNFPFAGMPGTKVPQKGTRTMIFFRRWLRSVEPSELYLNAILRFSETKFNLSSTRFQSMSRL